MFALSIIVNMMAIFPDYLSFLQPGCVSGFIGDPHELRMECPTCKQATCFQCKKPVSLVVAP